MTTIDESLLQRRSFNYLYVLAVPLAAAIGCVRIPVALGFRHTGFIWGFMLIAGLILLIAPRERSVFPWRVWFPWYALTTVSLMWSELTLRANFQDCLQLLTPPVVGIIASRIRYDRQMLEQFFKLLAFSTLVIAAAFWFFNYGPGTEYQQTQGDEDGFRQRAAATTMCIAACAYVARAHQLRLVSLLGWLFCLGFTIISGGRTASAAILVLWCVVPRYQRSTGRPLAVGTMVLAGLLAFTTPMMQDRFFPGKSGSFSDIELDDVQVTAGRSTAWPLIWKEAKQRPVIGHGVGSSKFICERVWTGIDKPHNDYLRVTYETGFVGLALFLFALLWQLMDMWRIARRDMHHTNWPATAAFLGFVTLSILAVTDNPIIYNLGFMNPLFAVLGIAYSIRYRQLIAESTGGDPAEGPWDREPEDAAIPALGSGSSSNVSPRPHRPK